MYRNIGGDFFRQSTLFSPPSGAATALAFAGNGTFVGLVEAPPPFMSAYKSVAPFDTNTEFIMPKIIEPNHAGSTVPASTFIKALS